MLLKVDITRDMNILGIYISYCMLKLIVCDKIYFILFFFLE